MIQDKMINEIQELKLSGLTPIEVYETLKKRHKKVPTLKTIRKYYNMDCVPLDTHSKLKKELAFGVEPFRSEIIKLMTLNPGCYMSSIYDVLIEKYVESGQYETLPGNEQTLRHFIHFLKDEGEIPEPEETRRIYDIIETPPPGDKAQIDFGQIRCEGNLVVHFICIVLWHSRLLGVYAQDHKFDANEACRAIHRFTCKCGGRPKTLVIDQDSVFVSKEIYGEVFATQVFKSFLEEQELNLWVCNKADPESKGCVENAVGFVKKNFFSARRFECIDEVIRALPAWTERKNKRIHQGTCQIPNEVFNRVEKDTLRPVLPSIHEAAPLFLSAVNIGNQPFVLHGSVRYSVPFDMCYSQAFYRVIGDKLHIYDSKRRYVCTHVISPIKGSVQRLEQHRRETQSDWLDVAERMRDKWNCTSFQTFINGFRRSNPERHLCKQLIAVERYLDEQHADRTFTARVMSLCCENGRFRYTQFKAVFDTEAAYVKTGEAPNVIYLDHINEVESRSLEGYKKAFEERCAL